MTHQVALSEPAYAALKRAKRGTESFSDAVLRLLQQAHRAEKDPHQFGKRRHQFRISMQEHLAEAEAGREGEDPYARS